MTMPRTKRALRALVTLLRSSNGDYAEQAKRWQDRYEAVHQRIVDLALEHVPKLRASNEDDLPGLGKTISLFQDHQPNFVCSAKGCAYFWPCPTYQWATGSERFELKVESKAKPKETTDD